MANDRSRRRRSSRTSASGEAEAGEAVNPHRPGTNAHGAFERMQRRRERDAEFAKTPAGKKSAEFHNALPIEETAEADLTEFDPVEHEGSVGDASNANSESET